MKRDANLATHTLLLCDDLVDDQGQRRRCEDAEYPSDLCDWALHNSNLARVRLSYSFSPRILLQLLAQYNEQADTVSTNLRFSWLRSANSGLYIVYNELDERGIGAPPRGREIIVKYSHIFDVFN